MDSNKKSIIKKRIDKTGENLRKNNMEFYYAETASDVPAIVKSLIKPGDTITNGGTMTMSECGLTELLNSPEYNYLDRSKMSQEQIQQLYIDSFSCNSLWTKVSHYYCRL